MSITIDETINMFEEAIKANETAFPNEIRQIADWLKELKWWWSLDKHCISCKYNYASVGLYESDNPCIECRRFNKWECGYEGGETE